MFKRFFVIAAAALTMAAPLSLPARADTYSLKIQNRASAQIVMHTPWTECMRGRPSATIPPHSTIEVRIDTETRDNDCWMPHRASQIHLLFTDGTHRTVVLLEKRALLPWRVHGVDAKGIQAHVEGSYHWITVQLDR